MIAFVIAVALTSGLQDGAPAPAPLPVSLDRIRQALQQPRALRIDLPPPPATFRVEVVEHPFFADIPYKWNFAIEGGVPSTAPSGALGMGPGVPLVQGDMLPALKAAKRALGERAARHEVQQAIAEFCAEHSCVLR